MLTKEVKRESVTMKNKRGRKRLLIAMFVVITLVVFMAVTNPYLDERRARNVLEREIVNQKYLLRDMEIVSYEHEDYGLQDFSVYIRAKIKPERARDMIADNALRRCTIPDFVCSDPIWLSPGTEGDMLWIVSDDEYCSTARGTKEIDLYVCVNLDTGYLQYSFSKY
jgi:hypothetical protein